MPPIDTKMSDFLNKAEGFLIKIQSQHENHEKQLEMYKEIIDRQMEMNEKRMDLNDKRYATIRGTTITIAIALLTFVLTSSTMLSTRPTDEELREDYFNKQEIMGGMTVIVDGVYETLKDSGIKVEGEDKELKRELVDEMIPEYLSRSVKPITEQ